MPDEMTKSNLSTKEQVATLWDLGGLKIGQLVKRVYQGITDDYLLDRAAALAFSFILALFPLMIFLFALFGIFASHGSALQQDLFNSLSKAVPPDAFKVITHTISEVTRHASGGKITLGLVLTLWFASGGMASIISGLDGVYELKETRSFFKVRLLALGLTIALSFLIAVALAVFLAGGYVVNHLGSHYGLEGAMVMAWRVGQIVIGLAFVIISFSLLYYYGPDVEEQHWYWITPGSLVGVALWVGASYAFRTYLHFFNSYNKTYGSLGAAMILLMWLFITGLAFLLGGEINAQIEHAAAKRGHPEAKAPGEKKAA